MQFVAGLARLGRILPARTIEMNLQENAVHVSVVMSAFNCQSYIAGAVESILQQTFRDFEFIVIDDGSTDGTAGILRGFERTDPRVRLISRENRGLIKSLNEAVSLSRGSLIARMDADDIALPHRLERQVEYMSQHPETVVVGSKIVLIDRAGAPLMRWKHALTHAEIVRRLFQGDGSALTHPAIMMRRKAFDAVGGYDHRFNATEDYDLYLKLSEVGGLANLDEVLFHWRQHSESVNAGNWHLWTEGKQLALKEAIDRRGSEAVAAELLGQQKPVLQLAGSDFWARAALRSGFYKTAVKYAWAMINQENQFRVGVKLIVRIAGRKLLETAKSVGRIGSKQLIGK